MLRPRKVSLNHQSVRRQKAAGPEAVEQGKGNEMHILGIDIAKGTFDTALTQDNQAYAQASFSNDSQGFKRVVKWLATHQVEALHVCLEATGRYGDALADYLHTQGHQVSLVNPAQIHAYGRSKLRRNKNDRLDAQLIADFCFTQQPLAWKPPLRIERESQELSRHIATLKEDRQRKRNQLAAGLTSPPLRRSIQKTLDFLNQEIELLEKELHELLSQDPDKAQQIELLCSIPGIGRLTACRFLAEVDVTRFRQASHLAAYAGLVPTEHTSGASVRKKPRLSKVGNRHLRTLFFMPALSAHRFNPIIADLHARLTERGKPKMAVVGAVMRKLLHLAYSVLKTRKPFDPQHLHSIPVGG
jgi:transposase